MPETIPYAVVPPWQWYQSHGRLLPMRPYEPGEDMTGIAVAATVTPQAGGMVACNPDDQLDQWYVDPVASATCHPVGPPRPAPPPLPDVLTLDPAALPRGVLQRLVAELQQPCGAPPRAYDRGHNRHNRGR